MPRPNATPRQVRIRATVLALKKNSNVTFRFQASLDGALWREIDSFGIASIGVHERTYPAPVEPRLRVLPDSLEAGCTAVVRADIICRPEPEGPRVERRN